MFDEGKIAYWLFSKGGIIIFALLMLAVLIAPIVENRKNTGINIEAFAKPIECQLNCKLVKK